MQIVVLRMLLIVTVSAQFGKHVYVDIEKTWEEARDYCKKYHTDLSPLTTQLDKERLKNATVGMRRWFWIGLYRNEKQNWMWTGEELATNIPWDEDEPQDADKVAAVFWYKPKGWHGARDQLKLHFFCFNLMVDEEKKTWEEALEHCRETHTDLTSLHSEAERRLAMTEIQSNRITEPVWIGLRYLGDRWLWVDGEPLVYEAWRTGDQEHQCPIRKRCGALTIKGHWENWDCGEKLNFICY